MERSQNVNLPEAVNVVQATISETGEIINFSGSHDICILCD